MNSEVFQAILAMDSYNRGYKPGVRIQSQGASPIGQNVGTAVIVNDSTQALGGVRTRAVGFYASAYEWNEQIFISFRGTNPDYGSSPAEFVNSPLWNDVFGGWTLGAGYADSAQAQLALEFYEAVAGVDSFYFQIEDQPSITLTGHSLGGGLAGFVGSLSGNQVHGYDHMPFGIAAYAQAIADSAKAAADRINVSIEVIAAALPAVSGLGYLIVTGIYFSDFIDAFEIEYGNRIVNPGIAGTYMDGEVLALVRDGTISTTLGGAVGTLLGLFGGAGGVGIGLLIAATGLAQGLATDALEGYNTLEVLPAYATGGSNYLTSLDPIQRHSMPFMVTTLYGREQWPTEDSNHSLLEWTNGFGYIAPSLYSDEIAEGLERSPSTGSSDAATQMSTMIAYSAINEGTTVFGDTGIRALSDDSADLGHAIISPGIHLTLQAGGNGIGAVVVEYAGLLALRQVHTSDHSTAADGILIYQEATANTAESLQIDLRNSTWDAYGRDHTISTKDELIESFLRIDAGNEERILTRIRDFYSAASGGLDILTAIDRASISVGGELRPSHLAGDGVIASFTAQTDFVIGGIGNDELTGSGGNDILIGGAGGVRLHGGTGQDFLYGGSGYNELFGDSGKDRLVFEFGEGLAIGGAGADVIDGTMATGTVNVTYRVGDGSDRLSYIAHDRSSLSFANVPTQSAAGPVEIRFEGYDLGDVRIEWFVTQVDYRVEPSSQAFRLFVGLARVVTLGGVELFNLGEVTGVVENRNGGPGFGGNFYNLTFPELIFDDDVFYASEGANAAFVLIPLEQQAAESFVSLDDIVTGAHSDVTASVWLSDQVGAFELDRAVTWRQPNNPMLFEQFA